jgi:soluble lytic murein transglycosylase-like protein
MTHPEGSREGSALTCVARRRGVSVAAAPPLQHVAVCVLMTIGMVLGASSAGAETAAQGRSAVAEAPPSDSPPPINALARPRGAWTRADIIAAIEREAKRQGVPAEIAEAVGHTESGFNPSVVGADGEVGVMQVMPATARMMGFSGGPAELADPDVNIRYGVTYLAQAYRLAGGDLCTAVMKYRAGHGETRFSHLSVSYCLRVRARLASRGYAVSGVVPTATFGRQVRTALGARCRGRCVSGSHGSVDLAALNNKLNQIVIRVTVRTVPRP